MTNEETIGYLRGLSVGFIASGAGTVLSALTGFVFYAARYGWGAMIASPSPECVRPFDVCLLTAGGQFAIVFVITMATMLFLDRKSAKKPT